MAASSSCPLPIGYRFVPRDYELIIILNSKIRNSTNFIIPIEVVDLYSQDPITLTETYSPLEENEWYFFTVRKRRYPNGSRADRSAGDGYWKATGDKKVYHHGEVVGSKTSLVFYVGKHKDSVKTDWIMHEYKLHHQSKADSINFEELVLCRIHENGRQPSDNEDFAAVMDDQDQDQELLAPMMNANPLADCVQWPSLDDQAPSINTHQDHDQLPFLDQYVPADDQELAPLSDYDQTDKMMTLEEIVEWMNINLSEDHEPSIDTHHQELPMINANPSVDRVPWSLDHAPSNINQEFGGVMDISTLSDCVPQPYPDHLLYHGRDQDPVVVSNAHQGTFFHQQQQQLFHHQLQQWIQQPNFHQQQQQQIQQQILHQQQQQIQQQFIFPPF